jgi:hypothetical protein
VGRLSLAALIIYLRKVMIRDNVVKIKKVDKAKAFMRDYLADGALKSTKEVKAAAAAAGHTKITTPFSSKVYRTESTAQKGSICAVHSANSFPFGCGAARFIRRPVRLNQI